ncbi:MAG: MarR family transcriptional regulator [Candidatus Bathyarchaeia archaeon]
MIDFFVILYIFLFLSTSSITLAYYRKVKQASKEYIKAKKALDDIIISFNRELQREEEKIRELTQRNEIKITKALETVERIEPKIDEIDNRLKKIEDSIYNKSQEQSAEKKKFEEESKQEEEPIKETIVSAVVSGGQESNIVTNRPIPLRREKALSNLTSTEYRILELLAKEGEKTAIQIRNEINLTREHTARLMKKLFISGYIERRTDRTPFVYRLKKEMEELLKSDDS